MRRALGLAAALAMTISETVAQGGYTPPLGFIPDAQTAIAVARAVLTPIYGAEKIRSEEPLTARKQDDVWVVSGTLPAGLAGGVVEVSISAKDGRILRVIHYR
jgi:hypothetical protein